MAMTKFGVVWGNLILIRVLIKKTIRLAVILWTQAVTNFLVGHIQLTFSQKSMEPCCDLTSSKSAQVSYRKKFNHTTSKISF